MSNRERIEFPLSWALRYLKLGWPIIPLKGKTPLCDKKKRFGAINGVKDATSDETLVRAWWARWPNANIGIATSGVSQPVRNYGYDG